MAMMLLLQFHTYIRPGSFDTLKVAQLDRPTLLAKFPYSLWGIVLNPVEDLVPGKTGVFDQAVLIDDFPWLHPFLLMLVLNRSPEDPLWPVPPSRVIALFLSSAARLGMAAMAPVRYSLRHGGASHDLLTSRRNVMDVKKRGLWRTDQSLRRYAKETRALAELHRMPDATLHYAELIDANLSAVFHRTFVPPLPTLLPSFKALRSSFLRSPTTHSSLNCDCFAGV